MVPLLARGGTGNGSRAGWWWHFRLVVGTFTRSSFTFSDPTQQYQTTPAPLDPQLDMSRAPPTSANSPLLSPGVRVRWIQHAGCRFRYVGPQYNNAVNRFERSWPTLFSSHATHNRCISPFYSDHFRLIFHLSELERTLGPKCDSPPRQVSIFKRRKPRSLVGCWRWRSANHRPCMAHADHSRHHTQWMTVARTDHSK